MRILGIDPDTRASGWAVIEADPLRVVAAGIVDTRGNSGLLSVEKQIAAIRKLLPTLPPVDYAVGEYPQSYTSYYKAGKPQNVNPNNLIMLAAITGAALAAANLNEGGKVSIVRPAVWKGQRSKGSVHRHVCRVTGWKYQTARHASAPLTEVIPDPDCEIMPWEGRASKPWSEILDAVGIALYELRRRHV